MSPRRPTPARTLRLVLGDQLNPLHPWFEQVDAEVVYVLMEVRQETDYVRHHAQKVLAILTAMRDFARHLREAGHRVRYVALDDPSNRQTLPDNLAALMQAYAATQFEYQAPDEWRLDAQLKHWCAAQPHACSMVSSEHFYTEREDLAAQFKGRQRWLMEAFYRRMRQQHAVLLDAQGQPEGGRWNFDPENRKPWPGQPTPPPDSRPSHDHSALWHTVVQAGVATFGEPQSESLRWPLNRAEALAQLQAFITHTLPHFGHFEDAMSSQSPRLFHSLLSFALNTKMLNPREVVQAAEAAYRAGAAPLAATEGFIRQVLGWREYVRGIYWAQMPGYEQHNALGHHAPLPAWFWTGQTQMRCLRIAIGQSLETAYAHHIQRLMIIGNFCLLAGIHPAAVHQWYLGVYIDAFEWVELPNTVGMSQFADGGLLATKPYVASAAYIHRMSDYCQGCAYRRQARTGDQACPFNALYWDFFDRHRERFAKNPRLSMVVRQLEKFEPQERAAISARAGWLRGRVDEL